MEDFELALMGSEIKGDFVAEQTDRQRERLQRIIARVATQTFEERIPYDANRDYYEAIMPTTYTAESA